VKNRDSLTKLVTAVDHRGPGQHGPDTVPSGFLSLDRALGGGFRKRDLVVLGGDVGSGKSAFALSLALRSAAGGSRVVLLSGEMNDNRLLERALAIQARARIDDIRAAQLREAERAALGAAALRIQDLPLVLRPLGQDFESTVATAWEHGLDLLVIDYLQLVPPLGARATHDEDTAASVRALKALALERQIVCLTISQLLRFDGSRPDPRPTLDDFGALGAVKHHADVVLNLYREEMYRPEGGVEGAAELIVAKNRNGPTGFVDLYFYQHWLRFEDMLDADR
jgi:replicative DNA helicase